MRNKTEIESLHKDVMGWFQSEFHQPYDAKLVLPHLDSLFKAKLNDFVKGRLNHLSPRDLANYISVAAQDTLPHPEFKSLFEEKTPG